MSEIRIALDAMGGDQGPSVVVPAAFMALKKYPTLHLVLVGDPTILEATVAQHTLHDAELQARLTIQAASQVVAMDESPALALRGKRDSSMRVAINLVKQAQAHACVSAGNTGALMATARFVLKMEPGIDRPAIVYALPTMKGPVYVLDLGANVDCEAHHLVQFAVMGSILCAALENKPAPTVGLLNIGTEAIKGNELIKQASAALSELKTIHYLGYVEGDDIYKGTADVVVCDGFVGNVALKASEGLAKMMLHFARQAFMQNAYTRLVGWLAKPILKALHRRFDPNQYNGAGLLGLRGIVIKSHGNANAKAFCRAIEMAVLEVRKNVPDLIRTELGAKHAVLDASL